MLLLVLASAFSAIANAADYQLGTMDKLRIRVVEWQTAEGAARDWSTVSGDYTVGPSGNVSIPFLGEMPATGKTTAEISAAISEGLQQKFGLLDKPDTSVELAEFRPVFISGDVQSPGKYPYAPDLTVLKAVSLAGGVRRAPTGQRVERDFINARGNHEVLVTERYSLMAKRARLIAEAEGKTEITFPKELEKSPDREKLMADETALMRARQKRLTLRLTGLEELKALLQAEITSLEKKIVTQNRQVELSRKELGGIGDLAQRGLVVNARVLSIERTIADAEGKVLDLETASLRAKQDISKATQDATTLQNDHDAEIAQSRQAVEADIAGLDLKVGMYQGLMSEALSIAPSAALTAGTDTAQVSYAIVRTVDGKATEAAAEENTPVLPGDVVKVGIAPVPVQ